MELELSLSPPNQTRHPIKKTFNGGCSVTRFPLVSWNHKEDDDEQSNGFYTGDYQQDHLDEDEEGVSYKLMYQHRDGHWHLGGDLPWEMFVRSVKRIQMVRN
ncbi:putative transcription factor interactor and regulator AUX-IAA family [Helianthus annuus]|nr:putative transcription factor interactor and regulator AUX-IAA family [Helianthus annuus]